MISRRRLSCTRDECDHKRYRDKLCAGHWLEDNPPQPRPRPERKPRPVRPRPVKRRTAVKARPGAAEDVTAETKTIVLTRCGGRCEACGKPLTGFAHFHHRQRRRGGIHSPRNIVALHPDCHVVAPQAVHQRPAWAKKRGLIVPSWADPAQEVLTLASGRRVLLDDEGNYLPPLDGVHYAA